MPTKRETNQVGPMTTPFDAVIEKIKERHYHNQRLEEHSDIVSDGFLGDLTERCTPFASDYLRKEIADWRNVRTPGARNRKIDLLVGEPSPPAMPTLIKCGCV